MLAAIDPYIMAALFFLVVALVLLWIKTRPLSVASRKPFFPPSRRAFLGQLEMAVRSHLIVYPYIPVTRVFKSRRLSRGQDLIQSMRSQHIDYILCSRKDLSVVCAITLDDNNKSTLKKKKILRKLCDSAEIPLLEYEEKPYRNVPALRRQIFAVCSINDSELPTEPHHPMPHNTEDATDNDSIEETQN